MREKFSREKRRIQQAERSGSGASSTYSWVYMNSLQFLDPFVEGRATAPNEHLEISTLKYDEDEEDIPEAASSSARPRRNVIAASTSSSSGFAVSAKIYKNDEEDIPVATQSSQVRPMLASTVPFTSSSSDEELEDTVPSQAKRMKGNKQQLSTLATLQNVAKTIKNITERVNSQVSGDSNNSRFLAYCDEMLLKMNPKRAESIKRKINYLLLDELELQELERN